MITRNGIVVVHGSVYMESSSIGRTALTAGLAGIQRGETKITQAAQDVVEATTQRPVDSTSRLEKPLLDQKEGLTQVEASAKVVKTADQMIGSMIDMRA